MTRLHRVTLVAGKRTPFMHMFSFCHLTPLLSCSVRIVTYRIKRFMSRQVLLYNKFIIQNKIAWYWILTDATRLYVDETCGRSEVVALLVLCNFPQHQLSLSRFESCHSNFNSGNKNLYAIKSGNLTSDLVCDAHFTQYSSNIHYVKTGQHRLTIAAWQWTSVMHMS